MMIMVVVAGVILLYLCFGSRKGGRERGEGNVMVV